MLSREGMLLFLKKKMPGNHLLFYRKRGKKAIPPIMNKELAAIGKMPCVKPEGNFAMRIYKPDTTVKYSLVVVP